MDTIKLDADHYRVAQLIDTMQGNEDREHIARFVTSVGAKITKEDKGMFVCYILDGRLKTLPMISARGSSPYEAMCNFFTEFLKTDHK
jgi:hypothetical protein